MTTPTIAVSFSCVCNASTNSECMEVDYIKVSPWGAPQTTPPTVVQTTEPPPVAAAAVVEIERTTSATTVADPSGYSWDSAGQASDSNMTNMKLRQIKEVCYKGESLQRLTSQVMHFLDCCSNCLAEAWCQGVNYYNAVGTCVLVLEDVEEGSVNLDGEAGCQFWTVVWKK